MVMVVKHLSKIILDATVSDKEWEGEGAVKRKAKQRRYCKSCKDHWWQQSGMPPPSQSILKVIKSSLWARVFSRWKYRTAEVFNLVRKGKIRASWKLKVCIFILEWRQRVFHGVWCTVGINHDGHQRTLLTIVFYHRTIESRLEKITKSNFRDISG